MTEVQIFVRPEGPVTTVDSEEEPEIEPEPEPAPAAPNDAEAQAQFSEDQLDGTDMVPAGPEPSLVPELDAFEDPVLVDFLLGTKPQMSDDVFGTGESVVRGLSTGRPLHASSQAFASFLPVISPITPFGSQGASSTVPPPPRVRRFPRVSIVEQQTGASSLAGEASATGTVLAGAAVSGPAPPAAAALSVPDQKTAESPASAPVSESARRLMAMRGGRW